MEQTNFVALLVPEFKELLKQKDYTLLKQVIREYTPMDLADSWKYFDADERLQIFKLLSSKDALKLFEILEVEDQRYLLGKLNEENVGPILEGIDSPDLVKIFHKMPPRFLKRMASLVKNQEAIARIDYLRTFPEHSAGSLMHPEFIRLSPKITAKQALSLLQSIIRPHQKAHLSALFVTDEDGKVQGTLSIQDLLAAPQDERLSEVMTSVEG
jgi:magnesium transporter